MKSENHSPISIVLPLFKPVSNWQHSLLSNISAIEKLFGMPPVFIVVNDGSADETIDAFFDVITGAHPNILYYSYQENMGKGYALRKGVELSVSNYTIITDFDFPYNNNNLKEIVDHLQNGYDIVTGKRTGSYYKALPLTRRFASQVYWLCNRLFLNLPVNDTQSGIKGFSRKGRQVFLETRTNRFLIDTEFILIAALYNIRHQVITVTLKPQIQFTNFRFSQYKKEFFEFLKIIKLKYTLAYKLRSVNNPLPGSFQDQTIKS